MKFRFPEVLVGCLLTVAVFAAGMVFSSQIFPPPRTERPQNQQADTGQRQSQIKDTMGQTGSSPPPLASEPHGAKGGNHSDGKGLSKIFLDHLPDWFVAFFTFALSVFTALLWHSTNKLWRAGEKQIEAATIAANAADLSARAAVALQLPIIRIEPDSLTHGDGKVGTDDYEEVSVSSVILSNLGTTKAFPFEILHGWCIGDELAAEPQYRFVDTFQPNFILEPDLTGTTRKRLTMAMPLEPGQWGKIMKGNYLWFYCALRYKDFMGETRSHGFCWRWTNIGMGLAWRVDDAPAYNRKT